MMREQLITLPGMVLHDNEPVFDEPWQAQAFAMVINLHKNEAFTWQEWADTLSSEIHSGVDREYYGHWLAALEKIVAAKGIASTDLLATRKQQWHDAAAKTPHGEPIEL